jgi:hypothetical protein
VSHDPLQGRTWAVEQGDVLSWLMRLPDDYADLLFASPPYESARTYGIGFDLIGERWVSFMTDVVAIASKKVRGLIAVNCEGQTRNYSYSAVPFLLLADLKRGGLTVRKPPAFHRVGIPGSGGPDWLRNDWEPVICVTRPGKLPWSDNTACGHPPKWAPGGSMSHRLTDGTRTNQRGKTGTGAGVNGVAHRRRDGDGQKAVRPSHRMTITRPREGVHPQTQPYVPPVLANPGNVIQQTYTADEVAALLAEAGDVKHCKVGGGLMGHELAHENEAPFPLELAEFFVKSFCPPGGIVLDPFCGSGTTGHAAVEHGRRFLGCDIRESQVELSRRRLELVTPTLFPEGT